MKYRLLFSDIDGTLRPNELPYIPLPNVEAVRAIQRYGVKFAVATGRGRAGVPDTLLNGLDPDYMRPEELEALMSFCSENGYPLILHFSDGAFACTGYEKIRQLLLARGQISMIQDGAKRIRCMKELPFSAAALMPKEAEARFQAVHGGLGLRFPYYSESGCDILRPGQDKAFGLAALLKHLGLEAEACVSVGDGNNDTGILKAAGLSFCVEDGAPSALEAADRICPASSDFGVAAVCRMIWPEAF